MYKIYCVLHKILVVTTVGPFDITEATNYLESGLTLKALSTTCCTLLRFSQKNLKLLSRLNIDILVVQKFSLDHKPRNLPLNDLFVNSSPLVKYVHHLTVSFKNPTSMVIFNPRQTVLNP